MPLNLTKLYNTLLDLAFLNKTQREASLQRIFDRDFVDKQPIIFLNKPITPTPIDGELTMKTLFTHLTTIKVCPITRRREYHMDRSLRLHWVRFHIDQKCDTLVFSVHEPDGYRTYIYNTIEKYVVVLEPLREIDAYYLLSAYNLTGKDAKRDKMINKYKKHRLPNVL